MSEEQQVQPEETVDGVHADRVDEPAPDPVAEAEAEGAQAPPTEEAEGSEEPDYNDLYLRAVADADNVRKRARRDVGVAEARGMARVVRELLPALDNLERAIAAAEAQELDEDHHM